MSAINYEQPRLEAEPYPVEISWRKWMDPADPAKHRPVLVLRKGSKSVLIGPSSIPALDEALSALEDAWTD